MSKDSGRAVRFTFDTIEERQAIVNYALANGFGSASNLIRYIIKQYMRRYVIKNKETMNMKNAIEKPANDNYIIYLLHDEKNRRCKIGKSRNVNNRRITLSNQHKTELKLLNSFEGKSIDEITLHHLLGKFWIKNEWFHDYNDVVRGFEKYRNSHNSRPGADDE